MSMRKLILIETKWPSVAESVQIFAKIYKAHLNLDPNKQASSSVRTVRVYPYYCAQLPYWRGGSRSWNTKGPLVWPLLVPETEHDSLPITLVVQVEYLVRSVCVCVCVCAVRVCTNNNCKIEWTLTETCGLLWFIVTPCRSYSKVKVHDRRRVTLLKRSARHRVRVPCLV